jgi:peptide deformylase
MALREIIFTGDERLRQKSKKVKQFTPGLKQLAADMLETMRQAQGVGLAAPQVGVMQRLFVAEIPAPTDDNNPESSSQTMVTYTLVNPELIKTSDTLVEGEEGCLSIPDWLGLVNRPEWVELQAQDLNGKRLKLKADGLLARIFLHELDHLNGILFIDHITDRQKLRRLSNQAEPSPAEIAIQ